MILLWIHTRNKKRFALAMRVGTRYTISRCTTQRHTRRPLKSIGANMLRHVFLRTCHQTDTTTHIAGNTYGAFASISFLHIETYLAIHSGQRTRRQSSTTSHVSKKTTCLKPTKLCKWTKQLLCWYNTLSENSKSYPVTAWNSGSSTSTIGS